MTKNSRLRLFSVILPVALIGCASTEPAPQPAAATVATPAPPTPTVTYIVKPGDTVRRIARQSGVPLEEILRVNEGVHWQRLLVGQSIRIPVTHDGESRPTPEKAL